VTGQECTQVFASNHWANTWTATTVRDAEGFVQVEV
jgi:hypothetical protein